eukprot:scaffold3550_cov112-Isochrysis_galbana.AAC.3
MEDRGVAVRACSVWLGAPARHAAAGTARSAENSSTDSSSEASSEGKKRLAARGAYEWHAEADAPGARGSSSGEYRAAGDSVIVGAALSNWALRTFWARATGVRAAARTSSLAHPMAAAASGGAPGDTGPAPAASPLLCFAARSPPGHSSRHESDPSTEADLNMFGRECGSTSYRWHL